MCHWSNDNNKALIGQLTIGSTSFHVLVDASLNIVKLN